ncbi:MAG: hypothetical protein ACYCX2_00270 [Christensenellales bacterium]
MQVRDYIYAHPDSDIVEITKETGVNERTILDFLKEDRLSLNTEGLLACEKCGRSIKAGRFCSNCQRFYEDALKVMGKNKDFKGHERKEEISGRGIPDFPIKGKKMHLTYNDK